MPRPNMQPASKPYLIETLPQLRALRSPARQEILDAVQAAGPCSIAELGALLGRAPDSLYYHARSLLRLGLLIERPSGRARPVTLLDVPGRPMKIRYRPDAANRRALRAAVTALLRLTARDFSIGVSSPEARADGPSRNLWAARVKGRLNPAETARLSSLLHEASELLVHASRNNGDHRNSQLLALTFCVTPTPPRRSPSARGAPKTPPFSPHKSISTSRAKSNGGSR